MKRRIYLGFDGVINHIGPNAVSGAHRITAPREQAWNIPPHAMDFFSKIHQDPSIEIIWASFREGSTQHFTDHLKLAALPYISFVDPSGEKHRDIADHFEENPTRARVEVHDIGLPIDQIQYLTNSGFWVYEYDLETTTLDVIYPPVGYTGPLPDEITEGKAA